MTGDRPWIVLVAGSRWDEVAGTDKQLALALTDRAHVLWVDPALSATTLLRPNPPRRSLHEVADGVHRLQPIVPPAATRVGMRSIAQRLVHARVRSELRHRAISPMAQVVLGPRFSFVRGVPGARVFFVTDDWVAGASMMGVSSTWMGRQVALIGRQADAVAAVSPGLAETLRGTIGSTGPTVAVIPNGTHPVGLSPDIERQPVVGLVGHLNERLDYAAVTAVAERGIRLRIIGPVTARDPATLAQLSALRERPNVEWVGTVSRDQLLHQLASLWVGITPYVDNTFNRASFPLKTLEYLGAGLPVVSSDLPAARWLATEHVSIASSADDFAQLVAGRLAVPVNNDDEVARVRFATTHDWRDRADRLFALIDEPESTRPRTG